MGYCPRILRILFVLSTLLSSCVSDSGEKCGEEICGHRAKCGEGYCECKAGETTITLKSRVTYCQKRCDGADVTCPMGTLCVEYLRKVFVCMCDVDRGYQPTPHGACQGNASTERVPGNVSTKGVTVVQTTSTDLGMMEPTGSVTAGTQHTATDLGTMGSTHNMTAETDTSAESVSFGVGVGGWVGGLVLIGAITAVVVLVRRRSFCKDKTGNNHDAISEIDHNYQISIVSTNDGLMPYTEMGYVGQPEQHNNGYVTNDRDGANQSITVPTVYSNTRESYYGLPEQHNDHDVSGNPDRTCPGITTSTGNAGTTDIRMSRDGQPAQRNNPDATSGRISVHTDDNITTYLQMNYGSLTGLLTRREESPSTMQATAGDCVNAAPRENVPGHSGVLQGDEPRIYMNPTFNTPVVTRVRWQKDQNGSEFIDIHADI